MSLFRDNNNLVTKGLITLEVSCLEEHYPGKWVESSKWYLFPPMVPGSIFVSLYLPYREGGRGSPSSSYHRGETQSPRLMTTVLRVSSLPVHESRLPSPCQSVPRPQSGGDFHSSRVAPLYLLPEDLEETPIRHRPLESYRLRPVTGVSTEYASP